MQALLLLIYRYRAFLLFVALEATCVWLIVNQNSYQSALFLNSSNAVSGSINASVATIQDYFNLTNINNQLAEENAFLRRQLARTSAGAISHSENEDTTQFIFTKAKVVNNSTHRLYNFLTIDKGSKDGVYPEMGITGPSGIVGKVKSVSENFATVYSVLHSSLLSSVYLTSTGNFCTLRWDGIDPQYAKLLYLPRHLSPQVGDTVVTSGYNAIFPPDIMVGWVSEININENEAFLDVKVKLATDFSNLSFVYCIENIKKEEKDDLEEGLFD